MDDNANIYIILLTMSRRHKREPRPQVGHKLDDIDINHSLRLVHRHLQMYVYYACVYVYDVFLCVGKKISGPSGHESIGFFFFCYASSPLELFRSLSLLYINISFHPTGPFAPHSQLSRIHIYLFNICIQIYRI